jgi:hypothetical protein
MRQYGVGPYADSTTRLETELQASIDLERLPQAIANMDRLANDRAAAQRVFGEQYRVVKLDKPPRNVWDQYVDAPDGAFANTSAGLRFRTENGVTQINFKPPGGRRYPNGMAHRVEGGIRIQASELNGVRPSERLLAFFRNSRLVDNPLREFARLYPGRRLEDFFNGAVDARQRRQMYEVQRLDQGQWMKVSEISLDHVTGRDPSNHSLTEEMGRVELEGDHVSLQLTPQQQAALANAPDPRPHRAADAADANFAAQPDVIEIHRLSDALSAYLDVRPSGMSKFAELRQRLIAKAARLGISTPLTRSAAQANAQAGVRGMPRAQQTRTDRRAQAAQVRATRTAQARAQVSPRAARPR